MQDYMDINPEKNMKSVKRYISLCLLVCPASTYAVESHDTPPPPVRESYTPSLEDLAQEEEQIILENSGERRPQLKSIDLVGDDVVKYQIHGGRDLAVDIPRVDLRLLARLNTEESTSLVASAFRHLEEFDPEAFGRFENTSVRHDDLGDTILKFDQYIAGRLVAAREVTMILGQDGSLHSFVATP